MNEEIEVVSVEEELITAQKDSNWFEDTATENDETPITEYDLTSVPNDFNVRTIFDFLKSGNVIIPDFQRNYVWDLKRASKLIESIILGIPIPQVFLYEENRNRFLVIDGQQRLMSIYFFIQQRFPRMEKRAEVRQLFAAENRVPSEEMLQDDEYFTKFSLKLPSAIKEKNKLDKLTYSNLEEYKTQFEMRTIRNIIIKQNAPQDDDSSIYELFNRLNTGGMNLTPQEIRTSLYHSDFYSMLYSINKEPKWRRLLQQSDPDLHKKDIEVLLRGFAMLIWGSKYTPSMTKFLNNFSKHMKTCPPDEIVYLRELFDQFLDATNELKADLFFGLTTGKFNFSIFEAVFAAICAPAFSAHSNAVPKLIPEKLAALKIDPAFVAATQKDTASTANVKARFERALQLLNN